MRSDEIKKLQQQHAFFYAQIKELMKNDHQFSIALAQMQFTSEIAFQLAVMNERNSDQSAGKKERIVFIEPKPMKGVTKQ